MAADQNRSLTDRATPSIGREETGAWVQAVMLTLLAWIAVCCTGLGAATGAGSQTLVNKLAAHAQHLQRHGASSFAYRAARRDHPAAISVQQVADAPRAMLGDDLDRGLPTGEFTLRVDAQRADEPPTSANEPHLKPRKRAHPSRAPPVLA